MKIIALTNGCKTIVDDEDYDYLSKEKWYFCNGYAVTTGKTINKKRKILLCTD